MKKAHMLVIAILIAIGCNVIAIPASASGIGLDQFINEYNIYASMTGADVISRADLNHRVGDSGEFWDILYDNQVRVIIAGGESAVKFGSCTCNNEAADGDFLSSCAAMAMAFSGHREISDICSGLLFNYLMCKSGNGEDRVPTQLDDGAMFSISPSESLGYTFTFMPPQ